MTGYSNLPLRNAGPLSIVPEPDTAYGAVGARRGLWMRGDSSFYASSVVSSSSPRSNSISRSKI